MEHSGVEARLKNVERGMGRMQGWVIAGMGAIIIQLAMAVFSFLKHPAGPIG